ncbi:NAD(P)H-quinone oxidoreductase [Aquisalinus flavus]|nr:NAD(P)H-quinone oxidoreductase [Aquisalinus flavus]MBD0426987.1 NAD(P)H-quinone oxidoreductase [Aquisalinus flavus]UNE46820.1 NAD(P)H-quinone oxidoreductase [Aquisalinus flavus]
MTAIEISQPGGPEVLKPVDRARPEPGLGEVLIRVEAAGINRPDVLQRKGLYPAPDGASDLPGLEVAGEIVALGTGAPESLMGTRVCALLPGGGYAQYATVDHRHCLPVPDGFSMIEAAAMPETFCTVWTNLFQDAGLTSDERLLMPGGSSGIGTTAIMIARAIGAEVFATAGTDEKCAAIAGLGATRVFNYTTEDWETQIRDAGGVDVVLDMVGGENVNRHLTCLRPHGRHVSIAFLGGMQATIDIVSIMRKRLTLTGSTLRARSADEKAEVIDGLREHVWPLADSHRLKPLIDSTFPLERASEAHARMEDGGHIGKIVLTVDP